MSFHSIYEFRSQRDAFKPESKLRRWAKEWSARRRETRLKRELEEFFASINPAMARDIGVPNIAPCTSKPGRAPCDPHLIAVTALSLVSRTNNR